MCGIVGIAGRRGLASRDGLITMRDTMSHRGPDNAGVWWSDDGHVGLAHRRLSIIDLSPAGRQPMADASGDLWITYNGEIYNYRELRSDLERMGHRFQTSSDTEVLLTAYRNWGLECLERLNGMFAFGLYDARARKLILARDRAGEKPLFYRTSDDRIVFASELKALMADPSLVRIVDPTALQHYLAYGYVAGEACILAGVRKLPAAHVATYDLDTGALTLAEYWRLPEPGSTSADSPDVLDAALEVALRESVRQRLVADVPVGILLSGGIDSSLVTAIAAQVSGRVKTFTISFAGHDAYDEAEYARRVAKHFGTDHTELVAEASTVELLPELARQYDEPLGDSSMVPTYLVSRLVRRHATVALGGDGGDELFGGYLHYSWLQRQNKLRRAVPHALRVRMGDAAARLLPAGFRGRNYILGLGRDLPGSIAQFNSYFDGALQRRLLAPLVTAGVLNGPPPEMCKTNLCRPGQSVLQAATTIDFSTYLVDDILVKIDRASMLASLEVRAPWLDHRLIEFAFSRVPDELRATMRERKILPRRLAARLLPDGLDLGRKQGFSLPLSSWLQGQWGRYVERVLADADPRIFDPATVRELIDGQQRGYSNAHRLFALVMFELWRREYRVSVPVQ
jgi:asparagine synthase (glutamine-hydrolysing)